MPSPERTVILYHGGCPDGFGGAYAAWKKFGDKAEYVPLHRGKGIPEEVDGANVYLIDFTFNTIAEMQEILTRTASLVVLDHHAGIEEVTKSVPEYVYDVTHSGATLAWNYFHPDTETPYFLKLLEDQDLFLFNFPDTSPLHAYLEVRPFTFAHWDDIAMQIELPETRDTFFEKSRVYAEYFELLADMAVGKAHMVSFEGHEVLFGTCHPFKSLKSRVGNLLALKKGPLALVVSAHPYGFGVSIRGDGTVDVAGIAKKFGGNGHPSSAGFLVPRTGPFPWELIEDDEDTRD